MRDAHMVAARWIKPAFWVIFVATNKPFHTFLSIYQGCWWPAMPNLLDQMLELVTICCTNHGARSIDRPLIIDEMSHFFRGLMLLLSSIFIIRYGIIYITAFHHHWNHYWFGRFRQFQLNADGLAYNHGHLIESYQLVNQCAILYLAAAFVGHIGIPRNPNSNCDLILDIKLGKNRKSG